MALGKTVPPDQYYDAVHTTEAEAIEHQYRDEVARSSAQARTALGF